MDVQLATSLMSGESLPYKKLGHKNEPLIMGSAIKQSCSDEYDTTYNIMLCFR